MFSNGTTKPAVTVVIKGETGDVTPKKPLINVLLTVLNDHWGNTCR